MCLRLATALVLALLAGCDGAAPRLIEVEAPGDTRDPAGPYEVTATTRGATDAVVVGWTSTDGGEGTVSLHRIGDGRWVGGLPGQAVGTSVGLSVVARGPGGSARFPTEGEHRFRILARGGGCRVDGECLDGEICDRLRGQCKAPPATCQDDGDCPADSLCSVPGGACRFRPSTCARDADCGDGLVCQDGLCVTRPECSTDDACPAGARCIEPPGRCAATDECTTNDTCPADRPRCQAGRCIEDACLAGCPRGTLCVEGACVPEGACGGGCERGARCVVELDRCGECGADGNCPQGSYCDTDSFSCRGGRRGAACVPCGRGGDCGDGFACVDGYGFCAATCGRGDNCPDGYDCQQGYCIPQEFCSGFECFDASQCDSQVCAAGTCEPPQYCSGSADCAGDRACRDGRCVPRAGTCADPFDCAPDSVCLGGQCVPGRPAGVCAPCGESAECASAAFCLDVDGTGESRCVSLCGAGGCPGGYECFALSGGLGVCLDAQTGGCAGEVGPACGQDQFEPNDDPERAVFLAPDAPPIEAWVCVNDVDWFAFEAGPRGTLRIGGRGGPLYVSIFDRNLGGLRDEAVFGFAEIDLAGVQAGFIAVRTDEPGDQFYELSVASGQPNPACADDGFEENDVPDRATRLGSGASVGATACPGDADWYRLAVGPEQRGRVVISPQGTLRYQVRLDGQVVDEAVFRTPTIVSVPPAMGGVSHVGLWCEDCRGAVPYRLDVSFDAAAGCDDDNLEPNNSADEAWPLDVAFDGRLTVCADDEDWFQIEKGNRGFDVRLSFRHALGDIDVFVVSADGDFQASSTGVDDAERVTVPDGAPRGAYWVQVVVLGAAANSYRLQVEPH